MLTVLLFNSIGYRIVSSILESRADNLLDAKIDAEQFDESELIEIKIPINLPYHTEWKEFERYSGEVEVNGTYYKYVKRKIAIDSLILLCIPNNSKLIFESSRDKFFELVNDLKTPLEKKAGSILKGLITDYLQKDNSFTLSILPFTIKSCKTYYLCRVSTVSLEKPIKPPEA